MKDIKLIRQETDRTCTHATLRMIFHVFGLPDIHEMELEKLMPEDNDMGVSTDTFIKTIQSFGLKTELVEDASHDDLECDDSLILVFFSVFGTIPHVSVLKETTRFGISLVDPALGHEWFKWKKWDKIWFSDENKRAFLKVTK